MKYIFYLFRLPLYLLILLAIPSCLFPLTARAQVSEDGTTSTTVNQDGNDFTIEQGDRAGDNLFHSFDQFSVPTGGSAAFNNAADIANIFSRVTGSNISNIDGLLSANGAANLYLINPNGIIFGENARLDLGGSFFASTADSLLFEGNTEFSARNPNAAPLLEVSIPIGASFRDNPGDIVNRSIFGGVGLAVKEGQNIALIGGDVSFEGGIATAPEGKINLGGLSAEETIELNTSFSFPDEIAKANVSLSDQALVKVRAGDGGFINVNALNFSLSEESILLGGIESGMGSPEAQAGNIVIHAESILVEDNSQVSTATEGIGSSGNINITATNIKFKDELRGDDLASRLIASTFGQGDAGDIDVNANEISLDGSGGGAVTTVGLKANDDTISGVTGNAGNININTNSISIFNGAGLNASSAGKGNGGNVTINAMDLVSLDGRGDRISRFSDFFQKNITRATALKSEVRGALFEGEDSGVGNAGTVSINTNVVYLDNRAEILTPTSGIGNAGDILINASSSVTLDNTSQIISQVFPPNGTGNAGNIVINTSALSLDKGSNMALPELPW